MIVTGILDEDFTNYKKPAMFIAMPYCNGKCNEECGKIVCQNEYLKNAKKIELDDDYIIKRYLDNKITSSIVFGAREPFDSFDELYAFIDKLRNEYKCQDDVVIYTGYKITEVEDKWQKLKRIPGCGTIIVKFGRFIPDQQPHFDDVLGIELASDNQYAVEL